jgi:hypothetical protein
VPEQILRVAEALVGLAAASELHGKGFGRERRDTWRAREGSPGNPPTQERRHFHQRPGACDSVIAGPAIGVTLAGMSILGARSARSF